MDMTKKIIWVLFIGTLSTHALSKGECKYVVVTNITKFDIYTNLAPSNEEACKNVCSKLVDSNKNQIGDQIDHAQRVIKLKCLFQNKEIYSRS